MAHPARGPAVPRTAVSLHKHSTGHGRPSTPGSGLPAHAPAQRPQRAAAARAQAVAKVRLSAQPPADRSVQPLIQRHGWTAPATRWAARHCSGPPGEGNALEQMLRLAPTSAPQGAHKEGTGAAALCPCHCFLSPPFPLVEGALRLAALQAVGRLVFYWPGCVLRPCRPVRPRNPRMPASSWRDVRSPRPWQRCVSAASCCGVVLPPSKAAQCNAPVAPASRPGLAAARCLRSLDTRSLRIGSAAQGGSTTQMPQQPAASRPGSSRITSTPARGRHPGAGGLAKTRRCPAAAHSPQKNPLEEDR